MLGNFYDAKTDRFLGSIFRNEMEYHMFTRTVDGFCDKCDLKPPERTNADGFKLPGHRFHSKANEFPDVYFNNWQSDLLFTEVFPENDVQFKLFKFDKEGQFLIDILSQDELLRLLAGTFGETKDFQDFITCKEADFGIKIETGYWIETKVDKYPIEFKISMEHFQSSFLPTHIVTKVRYGYRALLRFACGKYNADECLSNFNLFLQCQQGQNTCPKVLDNLPSYKTWIGPASYQANCPLYGPIVMQLGVAFNEVNGYVEGASRQNNGKGIAIYPEMVELARYPDWKYDIGNKNELLLEAKSKLTIDYKYNTHCEINLSILAVLYKSILDGLNLAAECNSDEAALLLNAFREGIVAFRINLTNVLFVKDSNNKIQYYLGLVDKAIQHFWSSIWSPKELLTKLNEIRKREEEELRKRNFISPFIAKGVKVLPRNRCVFEERVILEFNRFDLSQNLQSWEPTIKFFNKLVEDQIKGRKRSYYINESDVMERSVFVKYCVDGDVISADMFGLYRSRNLVSKIRNTLAGTTVPWVFRMPTELLASFCPLKQCSPIYRNWSCEKCGGWIRYDSVTYSVVCFCGKMLLQEAGLKYSHQNYGGPLLYPGVTPLFHDFRSQLNILVLGVEGCGKSTFIYSLSRHLSRMNMKAKKTTVDEYDDEGVRKFLFEKKANQCRSYVIPLGETNFLKIIDTPGFPPGLINGVPFMASVLNYASQSILINALCIVVKSDPPGSSMGFEFMFDSLLKVLLPNTLQNVFFLVTHLDCSYAVFEESSLFSISDVQLSPDILNGKRTFRLNNIDFINIMNAKMTDRNFDLEKHHIFWDHGVEQYKRLISDISILDPLDPSINLRYEEKYITQMEEIIVLP